LTIQDYVVTRPSKGRIAMNDSPEWFRTGIINFGLLTIPILWIIYIIISISADFTAQPEYRLLMAYDVFALIMLFFVLFGLLFVVFRLTIYKIGIGPTDIRIRYLTKEQTVNWKQIEGITTERFISIPSYSLLLKNGEKVSVGTISKGLLRRIEAHIDEAGRR